jgi:predicted lipoprotein with Yx(FWY)xxD motif
MSTSPLSSNRRRSGRAVAPRIAVAVLTATLAFGTVLAGVSDASTTSLRSMDITGYSGVLGDHASATLYMLSAEIGAKIHCKKACLSIWHPLVVRSSAKSVSIGAGVKGKIGFVARSATMKQVTYNSYPLYVYSGDSGPQQSHGEDVVSDGGTWTMLNAAARTPGATAVSPMLQSENLPNYSRTLANHSKRSLYLLSTEAGSSVQCTGSCLSVWKPLEVSTMTAPVTVGPKVDGTTGFVPRGSDFQVTFNTDPVYTYVGDTGPGQWNGEGVIAFGGTWYLLSASATTAAATPIPPAQGYGY